MDEPKMQGKKVWGFLFTYSKSLEGLSSPARSDARLFLCIFQTTLFFPATDNARFIIRRKEAAKLIDSAFLNPSKMKKERKKEMPETGGRKFGKGIGT